jgi:predicted ATPase
MAEATSLAKELNDMHALGQALWFAGFVGHFENNPAEVERVASDLIELSTRQNFPYWLAVGTIFRGWAWSALGDAAEGISWIDSGLRNYQATASVLDTPYLLALKAEALHFAGRASEALEVIGDAEALIERYEQRWCSAELQRLRGILLAATGAEECRIEASFGKAIQTAKQQKSVSLLKRAEASYSEYRRQKSPSSLHK